jgi:hypothetical protein
MPRGCTVCAHGERAAIDAALAAGEAVRTVASRYVPLSKTAVQRHKDEHMTEMLRKARQAREGATDEHALDVVKQLKAINGASLQILHEARQGQDPQTALKAVDRIQRQIELQAKLLGDLDDRPQVNVIVSPEWVSIRGEILVALRPYPEARQAVAARLVALEGGA